MYGKATGVSLFLGVVDGGWISLLSFSGILKIHDLYSLAASALFTCVVSAFFPCSLDGIVLAL